MQLIPADVYCLLALACIGWALQRNFGNYNNISLALLVAAVPLAAAAAGTLGREPHIAIFAALVFGYAASAAYMGPGFHEVSSSSQETVDNVQHPIAIATAAAAAGAVLVSKRWPILGWGLVAICAALTAAALLVFWRWGVPGSDVLASLQNGAGYLLEGRNPYDAVTLKFVSTDSPPYAGHFEYGPAIALIATAGRAFGDVRLASLVMFVLLFAAVVGFAADGERGRQLRIAAVCAGFPLTLGMIMSAEVDIFAMAPLAIWVALRRRYLLPALLALAVAIAAKPTFVLGLLPLLLWSAKVRREAVYAIAGAFVIALPFALWTGIGAFVNDVVGYYLFVVQTRPDALTLNAQMYQFSLAFLPAWAAILALILAAPPILGRRPRDYGDVFAAGAALSILGFLFAKQAFFNYYFVPAVFLLLALAGRGVPIDAAEHVHMPRLPGRLRRRATEEPTALPAA